MIFVMNLIYLMMPFKPYKASGLEGYLMLCEKEAYPVNL